MKFVFWHHDIHGPLSLEALWRGTHGFAGSVARLRFLFWLAGAGHEVYLTGNVTDGRLRGVTAIPGEPWGDSRLAPGLEGRPPVLVMQTAPPEDAWRRLKSGGKFTIILWLAGPLPHVRWIARARAGELASILCISEYQRNLYRIYQGFERLEVCYIGVDLDLLAAAAAEKSSEPVALFCSIPRDTKGLHHLLKAWPLVHQSVPRAQLWISGSARIHEPGVQLGSTGILEPSLERRFPQFFSHPPETLDRWGLSFLGLSQDLGDVYRAMKAATIAIVNCNWSGSLEMFCRSAVEAQAAGLPVVGAKAGSLPEVVHDGVTGLLIPKKNITALAGAIITLLKDQATRRQLSKAAIPWSQRFADYAPLVKQWEALAARAETRRPAPAASLWPDDFLRVLGYGAIRAWGREQIRGTGIEKRLLDLMRG